MPLFHKQVRKGKRTKGEHLTLFANGSYARRVDIDIWRFDKGSQGSEEPQKVQRGQWKTEGNRFIARPITQAGYGPWQDVGAFEKRGRNLLMVMDKRIEEELKQRNLKPDQGMEALMIVGEYTCPWAPK